MPLNGGRTPPPRLARSAEAREKRASHRPGGARAGARTLQELRTAAGKTQLQVATSAGVSQIEVSRAERRTDHRVSTLRRYVQALGGDLVLFARFGDRLVPLRDV